MRMSSVLMIVRLTLNYHSYVVKVSFQFKNENKTSLISAFSLIIEDQHSEIFGQNIRRFE